MPPSEDRERFDRLQFKRSFHRFCALNGIGRSTVAARLGVGYQTVVPWLPSSQGSRGNRKQGIPGPVMRRKLLRAFPEFSVDGGPLDLVPEFKTRGRVRRRELPRDLKDAIRSAARRSSGLMQNIATRLPRGLTSANLRVPPKVFSPFDEADSIRKSLDLGSGPIYSLDDVLDRLGVVVVSLDNPKISVVTLMSQFPYPVLAVVGRFVDPLSRRFELVVELGFWLAGNTSPLRAAAKLHAAKTFADELLVPKKALSGILVPGRHRVSAREITAIAGYFMVPTDVVVRQCINLEFKPLGLESHATAAAEPVAAPQGEPRSGSYRAILEAQLGIAPAHTLP